MNASQTARRLAVPAIVTAAVAAWFALAAGTAFAEANKPRVANAESTEVTLTPQGTMKLTVVAARLAEPTQLAMTPDGSLKLTVVAQRTQASRVRAAAARGAAHS